MLCCVSNLLSGSKYDRNYKNIPQTQFLTVKMAKICGHFQPILMKMLAAFLVLKMKFAPDRIGQKQQLKYV